MRPGSIGREDGIPPVVLIVLHCDILFSMLEFYYSQWSDLLVDVSPYLYYAWALILFRFSHLFLLCTASLG